MLNQEINSIGLGSFFPKTDAKILNDSIGIESIKNFELFYTGRHAIKQLLVSLLEEKTIRHIWLPSYYCQHVTSWLRVNFSNIKTYTVEPFNVNEPIDIESFTTKEDIVILNNFWGVYEYKIPNHKKRAIYIEDHSHGWLSKPCLQSKADYCFASLRKTLPIPLGGILWSPNGEKIEISIKSNTEERFIDIWEKINLAMTIKQESIVKEGDNKNYLSIIGETEQFLHTQYEVIPILKLHEKFITEYLSKEFNTVKRENFNYIINKIEKKPEYNIIQNSEHITFGLELIFKNRTSFESLKLHLIKNNIYPSELWPSNNLEKGYKYLLNIHIDYRYGIKAMEYIADKINSWEE
jgi:hypothetical protein